MGSQACRRLGWVVTLAAVLSAGCASVGDGGGEGVVVAEAPEATPAAVGAAGSGRLSQPAESPGGAVSGGGPDEAVSLEGAVSGGGSDAAAAPGGVSSGGGLDRTGAAPGDGEDGGGGGPSGGGPVSDTGVGGDPGPESVGPGVAGVRTGGLVAVQEPTLWQQLANEVYDLCDDAQAFIAVNRRPLAPGEEPTEEELFRVARFRYSADCDSPGGRRYIYANENFWSKTYPTAAEAEAERDEWLADTADLRKQYPEGSLLGTCCGFKREFPLEERDEIVVLEYTVAVRDGAVRGLVHNLSETLYARNVVVTARPAGADADQALSWRWPLTVQPGERAPFEIEGWTAGDDPAAIDVTVTADFSTDVDISRAFFFYGSVIGRNPIETWAFDAELGVPTSPPGLETRILGQTIEHLRVYAAQFEDRRVIEVETPIPHGTAWYGADRSEKEYVEIDSFPVTADDLPEPIASRDDITFVSEGFNPTFFFWFDYQDGGYQVWAGGANPPPDNQPDHSPEE